MSVKSAFHEAVAPVATTPSLVRRSRRGFAGMDQNRQRQIASMGGRIAHESGQAHEFTSEEARTAGRKGGETISRNRDHMAAIGRRGGVARGLSLQPDRDSDSLSL